MPHADVNGQRIAYDDTGGDGPTVVLAHGFLMDRTMFRHQVAALSPTYRVITWDERGFGETEYDGQPFSYWDSAKDCFGLMDHLGIDRAVVGGMSQGGFLSLRAALHAPERVRALVLLNSGADADDEAMLEANRGMVDMWLSVGPVDELAGAVASIIINDPVENPVWIAKWQARPKEVMEQPSATLLGRDDITPRLGEITCPTLIVHGTADAAISPERAEKLSAIPGAGPIVWIDGAAHAANLTHPEPVNAALLAFLEGLPA
jgi:3-oxoadipate enol-lactonase